VVYCVVTDGDAGGFGERESLAAWAVREVWISGGFRVIVTA
jgi:hypothetical protein